MKKFLKMTLTIALLSVIISSPFLVKASNNGISINYGISSSSANVYPGGTFTIYVSAWGATNGIASNTIYLSYDTSKFQLISASAPSPAQQGDVNYNDTGGNIIFLYADNGGGMRAIPAGTVAMFTFKALGNLGAGTFNFSVDGIGDNGGNSYTVTANSGSTSVNVIPAPVISSNNYLSSLTVAGGTFTPAFSRDITTYNVVVDADSTTIGATAEDSSARVEGTGYTTLRYGLNTFYVTCTAANGSSRRYVLNITRPTKGSTNTALSYLSVSNTKISYNGGYYYTATVENSVKKVNITAKASDSKTTITGTGMQFLSVGNNTFTITAVSESGVSATYTIVIVRESKGFGKNNTSSQENNNDKPNENEDNPSNNNEHEEEKKSSNNYLKTLDIMGASFKFDKDRSDYYITVPFSQETLEINYEAEDEKATVKVDAPGTLNVGSNTAFIEVTAENGDTRTYQLIITRNDEVAVTEFTDEAILAALDTQAEVVIAVNENNDGMLLNEVVLAKLKETAKMITIKILDDFGNIKDVIIINGKYLTNTTPLSFDLIRSISDKMLLDAIKDDYIGINTKGANIPEHTIIRHYIDSITDKYLLYYIKDGKVAARKLEIKNGYIEFIISNNANYAIVKVPADAEDPDFTEGENVPVVMIGKSGIGKWLLLGGGTIALAGGTAGVIYILRKKKKIIDGSEIEYLDLEPVSNSVAAPAIENVSIDTIPAMDTLDIDVETLSTEPAIEMLSIPEPAILPKDETTGATETYHYEWQKEYFTKKEQEDKIKADLNELLDPKYEIKPILSAEAIADTFVDVKIDFDFLPIVSKTEINVNENVDSLDISAMQSSKN